MDTMMRGVRAVALLALVHGLLGCGGRSSPLPSAATPLPVDPQLVVPVQAGYVFDTAFRPLDGVTVEIVDGPQAGTTMVSDGTGRFPLTGSFIRTNTFTARRDGYVAATQGFSTSTPGGTPWLYIYLAPGAAAVDMAGDYTLTFIADSACTDLPEQARLRRYDATVTTVTTSNPPRPANTSFQLTASGANLLGPYRTFTIGVAGDMLGFSLHGGHDPPIVEQLSTNTYLGYSGWSEVRVGPSPATISAPFSGWIEYCVLPAAMGALYNCGTSFRDGTPVPGASIEYAICHSDNHRLVMTRR